MGLKKLWKSLTQKEAGSIPAPEPLECVIREAQRDEHLKNLGMKRNKSIRRSIAKKLKRREKKDDSDGGGGSTEQEGVRVPVTQVETRTSIGASVEGGRKVEVLTVDPRKEPAQLIGQTQPLPSHITADQPRSVDRLRRSIRHSMRKRKESGVELSKAQKWQIDEAAVRSGTCQFYVKYLGCCEVFESRGMQVCEAAVACLKEQRRRTVRATLSVDGNSVRVIDDDTKVLVIDQTIEKVSFCAPDRNFERGFSYICRDGTTRRWMCHAFMAVGDSGERLSHAVGCAFGICLEYKQKRDKTNVSVNYDSKEASFTRHGSFRPVPMKERMKERGSEMGDIAAMPSSLSPEDTQFAVERPRPTESMYQRQASFRGLGQLAGASPFKRGASGQLSLRPDQLPSTRERRERGSDTILEDIELPPSALEQEERSTTTLDLLTGDDPFPAGIFISASVSMSGTSGSPTPSSALAPSPPPSSSLLLLPKILQPSPLEEDNPRDRVPDQPSTSPSLPSSSSHGDQWLISISISNTSSSMFPFDLTTNTTTILPGAAGTSSGYSSLTSTNSTGSGQGPHAGDIWEKTIQTSILEDPFDAEWAAIATRNSSVVAEERSRPSSTNPFLKDQELQGLKAFELQL